MRILLRKIMPQRAKIIDTDRVKEELNDALDDIKAGMLEDFESTVSTWSTPVGFKAQKIISSSGLTIQVQPIGEGAQIWHWINGGTNAHWVAPHGNYPLRWKAGGMPKTRAGRISATGGRAGRFPRASMGHWVGGIEPREWTTLIADKWKPEWKPLVDNAIRRATR